tara:strand:+ start:22203 stop:22445 length:243 start_codon:yes stop_codon:yes gene_type:complete
MMQMKNEGDGEERNGKKGTTSVDRMALCVFDGNKMLGQVPQPNLPRRSAREPMGLQPQPTAAAETKDILGREDPAIQSTK